MPRWTAEDDAAVILMRKDGVPPHRIAQLLNRTLAAVSMRFWFFDNREAYRIRMDRQREQRQSVRRQSSFIPSPNLGPSKAYPRPTDEMLAERNVRLKAPRPLVGWLMGDPAPGFSALDRRDP
jgi:hypothetical protein